MQKSNLLMVVMLLSGNLYGSEALTTFETAEAVTLPKTAWVNPAVLRRVYDMQHGVPDDGRFHFPSEYAPKSLYGEDLEALHNLYQEEARCVIDKYRFDEGFHRWIDEAKTAFHKEHQRKVQNLNYQDDEKDDEDLLSKLAGMVTQFQRGVAATERKIHEDRQEKKHLQKKKRKLIAQIKAAQKQREEFKRSHEAVVGVIASAQRSIHTLETTFVDIDDPKIILRRNQKIAGHQAVIDRNHEVAFKLAEFDKLKRNLEDHLEDLEEKLEDIEDNREFLLSKRKKLLEKVEQSQWSLQQASITEMAMNEQAEKRRKRALEEKQRHLAKLQEIERQRRLEEEATHQKEVEKQTTAQMKIGAFWRSYKTKKDTIELIRQQQEQEAAEKLQRQQEKAKREKQQQLRLQKQREQAERAARKKELEQKALEEAKKIADEAVAAKKDEVLVHADYKTFMKQWRSDCFAYQKAKRAQEKKLIAHYRDLVRKKKMKRSVADEALQEEFNAWQQKYLRRKPFVVLTEKAAKARASEAAQNKVRMHALKTGKIAAGVVDDAGGVFTVRPVTKEAGFDRKTLESLVQSCVAHAASWSNSPSNIDRSLVELEQMIRAFDPKHIEDFPVALSELPMVNFVRTTLHTRLMGLQGGDLEADAPVVVLTDPRLLEIQKQNLNNTASVLKAIMMNALREHRASATDQSKTNLDAAKFQYGEHLKRVSRLDEDIVMAKQQRYQHYMRMLLDRLGGPIVFVGMEGGGADGPTKK